MRSPAERASGAALVLLLVACGATDPSPTIPDPTPAATPAATSISPATASPSAEPTDGGVAVPAPGRPWTGAALLAEMHGSTRPGGVPDQLETAALAEAIADQVWTVDGTGWETVAVGGFCGPTTCTLELAGSHLGRAGEDLWVIEVAHVSGDARVLSAEVRSLPWELIDALDGLARELAEDDLDALVLTTIRWLPPPADPGRFVLSYRSGGEEGSCSRDLTLDAVNGEIVEDQATGC